MKDVILSILIAIASVILFILIGTSISGNIMTDQQKEFLHQAWEMKRECEMVLPRTEHCVLQFVPAQQKG